MCKKCRKSKSALLLSPRHYHMCVQKAKKLFLFFAFFFSFFFFCLSSSFCIRHGEKKYGGEEERLVHSMERWWRAGVGVCKHKKQSANHVCQPPIKGVRCSKKGGCGGRGGEREREVKVVVVVGEGAGSASVSSLLGRDRQSLSGGKKESVGRGLWGCGGQERGEVGWGGKDHHHPCLSPNQPTPTPQRKAKAKSKMQKCRHRQWCMVCAKVFHKKKEPWWGGGRCGGECSVLSLSSFHSRKHRLGGSTQMQCPSKGQMRD